MLYTVIIEIIKYHKHDDIYQLNYYTKRLQLLYDTSEIYI